MKNKLLRLTTTLFFFTLLSVDFAFAQGRAISGKVTSKEEGGALPGVSVLVKGTTNGTITNTDGNYQLNVPDNATLVFSFIGFTSQEVAVGNRTTVDVAMLPDAKALSEVVVIGYGTQTKRAVTGSVASVGYDKFKDRSFSNVTQALAGELPGVNITQAQGAPGQSPIIRIRGISSITAGTNPLYVVDGLPMENFNLNNINPQDIESVEVLKDASSAAIYGSRGANGVVIITTKLGKVGKTSINASYEFGQQEVTRKIDLMDAQQFVNYYVDAHNNAWTASGPGRLASDPNSVRPTQFRIPEDFVTNPQQFGKGTDWQDVMYRTAPSHNTQLSVSGGTDKTQFLFSGAYLDQEAVLDRNYYKRLSLRTNIKQTISEKIAIGANLAFTGIYDRTDGTQGKSDVVSLGVQSDPIFPVYNELGNLGFKDPNSTWYRFATYTDLQLWHPYSLTREIAKQNKSFNTMGTAYLEYNIIKDLKFRTSINGNLYNTRYNAYQNKDMKFGYSSALAARGDVNNSFMLNWLTENTLTYDRHFGSHGVTALVGYTAQKQRDEYSSVTAGNFPNDLVQTLNAGTVNGGTSLASEWSMLSYLARVNYNFLDRYFLTGTIRRDGSSRFGTNTKWGYFPSVSAGWLVSDENFLKNVTLINNLKLRASYGVAGNNQIPNYGPIGLLGNQNYVYGNNLANGLNVTNIANQDLKWEKTTQLNLGVDVGLLSNRLNLTAEVYSSTTNDLLLFVPVPDLTGFSTQLTNIGKMRNRGFEFGLNSRNLVGNFNWTTDFNLSVNRNKVLQLGPGNAPIVYTDFVVTVKTEVGQPLSNYYGYVFDGVYKNQAEIDASPHDPTTTPGDPIVRDVNGDGKITEADRTTIGNYQPNFTSGLTNTFSYKGLELSFMLQGSFGGEVANQLIRYNGIWNGGRNAYAEVANYWRSESDPGDGKHFKPTVAPRGLQEKFSSYWVEDGSFVRIKNVRVSYALPSNLLTRLPVKSARIFLNAENVHLFSKYLNYDPENTTYPATTYSPTATSASGIPSGTMLGVDYGSYPVPRIVTLGARFEF
ncbi:SusC/RagA family TonB-linked outer membrane protein [Adhaeribacter aerolatus]|uniref:SusC/RagA family TonB-linked outer membrane protein n=1 Tax=Adhaeribacter aerolatus TaxID=670289 RepID=A0A512AXH8_9BACT|nr:TonB-dependent receptor [Adhaeribacter aerolatus]GEO04404.1 SusC/RagA family TonB-linked outer membrane protein [Adhaeribacter aerolatus]